MDFRLLVVIGMLFIMSMTVGCDRKNNQDYIEETNYSEETTEQTISVEQFHSEYTMTEIDKKVRILDQYQTRGFDPKDKYGCIRITFVPLFDDKDITRIDYCIEDGNGYFMDTADFNTMKVEEMERRAGTLTTADENGYHCTLEEQDDIYFSIYYKHDVLLSEDQQHILQGNLIRKLSVVANVKYQDGSESVHRFAFDYKYTEYTYSDNFTNGKIYELTKK